MNDLTNLKKIIAGLFFAVNLLMTECVFPEDNSDTGVSLTGYNEPAETPGSDSKSDSRPPLDLSLPYNSFKDESGWTNRLLGRPFRDRLYLGMWTLHLEPGDDQESNNQLIAAAYKGYYGGTFINTHGDRVWSGGWQRTVFQKKYGNIDVEAGYRAGVMYGYRRYLNIVFPLFQTLLDIEYKHFGVELSWAWVVLTAGFYYRF